MFLSKTGWLSCVTTVLSFPSYCWAATTAVVLDAHFIHSFADWTPPGSLVLPRHLSLAAPYPSLCEILGRFLVGTVWVIISAGCLLAAWQFVLFLSDYPHVGDSLHPVEVAAPNQHTVCCGVFDPPSCVLAWFGRYSEKP